MDRSSAEFIPLLFADHRANRLTIWQKPVGAEYEIYGMDPEILKSIREDAISDIGKCKAGQVIVFEPTAYQAIREGLPDKKIITYLDCLN